MEHLTDLDLVMLVHACAPRKVAASARGLGTAMGQGWSGRLVLVENGARPATAAAAREAIAASFPAAEQTLVACRRNLGFAAGINLGVRECRRRFVGFFNPDGALQPNTPSALVRTLEADAAALAAGPGGPPERDWLPGTALVVRREAYLELGGFDPLFFMYFEDVDFSRRARAAGWKLLGVPAAKFEHRHDYSARTDFRRARQWSRSALMLSLLENRRAAGRVLVKRTREAATHARERRWPRAAGEILGTAAGLTRALAVERRRRSPWGERSLDAWARQVAPLVEVGEVPRP